MQQSGLVGSFCKEDRVRSDVDHSLRYFPLIGERAVCDHCYTVTAPNMAIAILFGLQTMAS